MKTRLVFAAATAAAILSSLPALALDAPDDLPLIGLEPGHVIEVKDAFTVPPAAALTGVAYQGGKFKEFYKPGQQTSAPTVANGGIIADEPVCSIFVRTNKPKFTILVPGTKLTITKVRPSQVTLFVSGDQYIDKIMCHLPGFANGDDMTVPQLKAAFGDHVKVLVPPFDAPAPQQQQEQEQLQ